MSIHLNSAEDTFRLGVLTASSLLEGKHLIGLTGELGAGKTTFTQGLAEGLEIDESVSSPTFLMLNEYQSGRIPLYHFDLYRLQEDLDAGSRAAQSLKAELDEIMEENNLIVLVEWINLWEEFADSYDQLRIEIVYLSSSEGRGASLSSRGASASRLLDDICSKLSENLK